MKCRMNKNKFEILKFGQLETGDYFLLERNINSVRSCIFQKVDQNNSIAILNLHDEAKFEIGEEYYSEYDFECLRIPDSCFV